MIMLFFTASPPCHFTIVISMQILICSSFMLLQLESSKVIVTTGTIAETSCRKTANTSGFSGKVFSMSVPWKQLRLVGYNNEPFL